MKENYNKHFKLKANACSMQQYPYPDHIFSVLKFLVIYC